MEFVILKAGFCFSSITQVHEKCTYLKYSLSGGALDWERTFFQINMMYGGSKH